MRPPVITGAHWEAMGASVGLEQANFSTRLISLSGKSIHRHLRPPPPPSALLLLGALPASCKTPDQRLWQG